jgi:CheY-like chemotaxis protein
VLWIGEASPPEFSRIFHELESAVLVKACASPTAALDHLARLAEEPALLLFAERFPGEFAAAEVAALRAGAPLARCLALLGSWCEGETRSGKPLPGLTRLYWHQWSPQAVEEIEKLVAGRPGEWSLPITATDEERHVLGPHSGPYVGSAVRTNSDHDRTLVAVWARERQAGLALAELLTAAGHPAQWLAPGAETDRTTWAATLVDLARGTEREWQELAAICADENSGPVIALLGFPRPEDAERAQEAGAAALISKPTRAAHLLATLRDLTNRAAVSGERHPQSVVR